MYNMPQVIAEGQNGSETLGCKSSTCQAWNLHAYIIASEHDIYVAGGLSMQRLM